MKNQSILVAAVLVASVGLLAGCNQSSQTPTTQPAAQNTAQQVVAALSSPVYASDNYITYTETGLEEVQLDGKNAAIFFHSKTCGSCATLDADFEANEAIIPNDLVVLKADWDENQELAAKLGVAKYHTVAYLNEDGTSENVKGLFTVEEVAQAAMDEDETEVVVSNAGEYIAYSEEAYQTAQADGKDTALFFHSKTCGSCAKLDNAITMDADQLPENLIVFKTDWDENQELATDLGVAKYHTVAFMNEDGTSKNINGLFTVSELLAAR